MLMTFDNPRGKLWPADGAVCKKVSQQFFVGMYGLPRTIKGPLPAQDVGKVASSIGHEDITVQEDQEV